MDNSTLCFQYFPCRASMIKSAKHAGPGYALPLSRCAVGKRYLCRNCTTKPKHPVPMSEQAVLKCYRHSSIPTSQWWTFFFIDSYLKSILPDSKIINCRDCGLEFCQANKIKLHTWQEKNRAFLTSSFFKKCELLLSRKNNFNTKIALEQNNIHFTVPQNVID